jgi:ribosomal protein S18 acetylase RimI-like enzyme
VQELTRSAFNFGEYLSLPNYRVLVAEENTTGLVGFAAMHIWRWNRCGQISELFVDPRQRSRGYGSRLLKELTGIAAEEGLRLLFDQVSSEEPGLPFYLRAGFTICGYNSQYFDRPEPAARTALIVAKEIAVAS